MHVKESFPDAPVLKLGFSCPVPVDKIRAFAQGVDQLVIVEEVEPLVEMELKAAGIECLGKDILPRQGELSPNVLKLSLAGTFGDVLPGGMKLPAATAQPAAVFPRPPTMCVACPHLGVYYTLAQIKNITISGDIGCYTLGAGHPWNALDTTISMGASMGIALGLDKGRGEADKDKRILAVIGDSTFLHMGMQGLLDMVYNGGNVTVLLLDNRAVGMTGGQSNPGTGRDIHGQEAPRVDFAKLVESLGVKKERIHVVDPYVLPTLFKTIREEIKVPAVSVIITDQPCVLIDDYKKQKPYEVLDDKCTGCGNCVEVGCPAIHVTRREKVVKPSGKEVELQFVRIETSVCTGCSLCVQPCAPDAIVHADLTKPIRLVKH
jgi:indolepyruvate ferredoxin oxidoreductase alpha subunit